VSVYRAPEELLTKPVPKEERVVEPLGATLNREEPVEEATVKRLAVEVVFVPATTIKPKGVVVPMPTFPPAVTLKTETPLDEATLKGSKVAPAWRLKLIVEVVALMPATVPLSLMIPGVKAEVP
jgi:hypothetical protein